MKNTIKNMALMATIICTSALFSAVKLRPIFYEEPWIMFAAMLVFGAVYLVCDTEG